MGGDRDLCVDEETALAFLAGELSAIEVQRVEMHADACSVCRSFLSALAAALSRSSSGEAPVSPDAATEMGDTPAPMGSVPLFTRGDAIGRYLVLSQVGVGGMGVVYAAYDPELDRKVAVKLLRKLRLSQEVARARLIREAQALARLTHPNVVTVYDAGAWQDQVFLAMEFVEGGTVAAWQLQPRPWRDVLDVYRSAGRGLEAAHARGLVHRDFKPDNVLMGSDGRVLVTDFGLARPLGYDEATAGSPGRSPPSPPVLTATGAVVGTPGYMAPEQNRGQPADARSDQYSFCVSLYEGLHGTRPSGPPPAERREVPAWLEQILARGLAEDPAARYPSMTALLDALASDPRAARRRRLAVAGIALTVAALLTTSAVLGAALVHKKERSLCKGDEQKLVGIWDPPRKQALRATLFSDGQPFPAERWRSVEAALDHYTRDWIDMRTATCEATRVTGEQSEALMELRMSCLDHRLDEVRALTSLLAAPTVEHIDATRAAYKLSPLGECADADALEAKVPLPREASARAEVERLRGQIAAAKALHSVGRYREQAERASAIVSAAKKLSYRPLEAEALLLQGTAFASNSEFARAADTLREAGWAAEEGHDFKLAVRARAELVWALHQLGQPALGAEYAHDGRAMLAGLGGDAELEAELADALSMVLDDQGQDDESMKLAQTVLEKRLALLGPDHPQTAIAMVNVAVGFSQWNRPADALPLYQRALAIYERTFGIHHPLYAHTLFNIADAEMNLGRYHDAREHAERALALVDAELGDNHALIASAEHVLGLVADLEGKHAEAEAHQERALALTEKFRGPNNSFVARYATSLGLAVDAEGQHQRALALFRRARSIYQGAGNEVMAARSSSNIGHVQLEEGARVEAEKSLQQALRVQEAKDKSAEDLSYTRFQLAQALWPRDRASSLRLARSALEGFSGPARADQRDEVARWLAKVAGGVGPR